MHFLALTASFHCNLTQWKKPRELSLASCIKALVPCMKALNLHDLNTSQRPCFLIPSPWGLEFQHVYLGERGQKHSIYGSYTAEDDWHREKILLPLFIPSIFYPGKWADSLHSHCYSKILGETAVLWPLAWVPGLRMKRNSRRYGLHTSCYSQNCSTRKSPQTIRRTRSRNFREKRKLNHLPRNGN